METILIAILAFLTAILVGVVTVLATRFQQLQKNFLKIGHLAREDLKYYFQEASEHTISISEEMIKQHTAALQTALQQTVQEARASVAEVLSQTEHDAMQILSKAQGEAESIRTNARAESLKERQQLLQQSTLAIEWALTQYVGQQFSVEEHNRLILQLVNQYLTDKT